jgi:dephospho-CoA kinase
MNNLKQAKLIGIAGRARSGKDTVADMLVTMRGGYRYSFADPIRSMLRGIGIDMNDPEWIANKEKPIPGLGRSPRYLMQTLGTEWGRQLVNEDIWKIIAEINLLQTGSGMIISDVRFDNETAWVRSMGGIVIHIDRPDAPVVEAHSSEAGVQRLARDIVIVNDGTLEDLSYKINELLTDA